MKATEAYILTQKNLQKTVIKPYIEFVDRKINEAIEQGLFSVSRPLFGFNSQIPDQHIQDAVIDHYRKNGYTIKEHDGNITDQRECNYLEIKWDHPGPSIGSNKELDNAD